MNSPDGANANTRRLVSAPDIAICSLLAVAAALLIWHCSHLISDGLRSSQTDNVWFESDINRVYQNISSRSSSHYRTKVHPLFSLFALPVSYTLTKLGHLSLDDAADAFLAAVAGLWAISIFLVVRFLRFDRGMATLAAIMGLVTSSSLFFLSVPETYGLASISILGTILIVLATEGTKMERFGAVGASACSLGFTVTNWMLGLLATFLRRKSLAQWIQLSINAFFVVTVFWTVEKGLAPTAEFFTAISEERGYLVHLSPARFLSVGRAFLFHSIIAPAVEQTPDFGVHEHVGPAWPLALSFQNAWPGSGSAWGIAAASIWGLILLLGVSTMIRAPGRGILLAMLGYLVFEFILHLVYGVETFMYALDWVPILIVIAVYGFNRLAWARWPAMIVFAVLLGVNNFQQFRSVSGLTAAYDKEHPVSHPLTRAEMRVTMCPCLAIPERH